MRKNDFNYLIIAIIMDKLEKEVLFNVKGRDFWYDDIEEYCLLETKTDKKVLFMYSLFLISSLFTIVLFFMMIREYVSSTLVLPYFLASIATSIVMIFSFMKKREYQDKNRISLLLKDLQIPFPYGINILNQKVSLTNSDDAKEKIEELYLKA